MSEVHRSHSVYEVLDEAMDGQIVDWRITFTDKDLPKMPDGQSLRKLTDCARKVDAENLVKSLRNVTPKSISDNPHDLPVFDARLPEDPKKRAAYFRGLPPDQQELLVYQTICSTARQLKRVAAWLHVSLAEVEAVVTPEYADAALAELEMRVAKKMIGFSLKASASTNMSASIFLSKAHLGWVETGATDKEASNNSVDINLKVTSNNNPEINDLRAELDAKVEAADRKAAHRLQ